MDLLTEVARNFCKLQSGSYSEIALEFLENALLAAHYEDEALRLAEHLLPIALEAGETGHLSYVRGTKRMVRQWSIPRLNVEAVRAEIEQAAKDIQKRDQMLGTALEEFLKKQRGGQKEEKDQATGRLLPWL
jgi:hypothetical protein